MNPVARLLLAVLLLAACAPGGQTVATPEVAGIVVAVDRRDSVVERYQLNTGAVVTVDRNKTIIALKTTPDVKARDLMLAGRLPEGDWVMEVGEGTLAGRADIGCFGLTLDALDAQGSVIFQLEPTKSTDPQWRLRLPKAAGFGWQRGGQPRNGGTYLGGTIFCLNGRGEVTGQLPR